MNPRASRTETSPRRQAARRPTSHGLLAAIAAASAVTAAFADAAPTDHRVADVVWRMAVGAAVPLLATDARRWSWFPLAGSAAAVGRGLIGLPAGFISLGLTFAAGFGIGRRRWFGTAIGAFAVQSLLRGVTYGTTGLPTLVAVAAVLPAAASTLRNGSHRVRVGLAQVVTVLVLIVVMIGVFTAVTAVRARDRIIDAIDLGDAAIAAAEDGDAILASSLIGAAGEEFDAVADAFSVPWLLPARYIPVLGQHARALGDLSRSGSDVATAAAEVLIGLEPDSLLPQAGRVDTRRVAALVEPMSHLRRELGRAIVDIEAIDDTWLAAPAADRVGELGDTLLDRFDTVVALDEVLAVAPALLGAEGERRYLVLFTTPAESRGSGGFAANWAEILAADGTISVLTAGRGDEINDALSARPPGSDESPGPPGRAILPETLDTRLYEGFRLTEVFQNLPAIVDFPTVAGAAAAFYTQATGREVDGVVGVDPDAMAGLVQLTGPIDAGGRTFDAAGVRDFVLTGQYVDFVDDEPGRLEVLDELTFEVFDSLLTGEPPSPTELVDVFGPLIDGDRLRMVSLDPTENEALAVTGLDDTFARPAGQDLLAVITQNLGENKIDTYLRRTIRYDATVDPATGAVTSRMEITLHNDAPAEGLPGAIIGNNDLDFRPGTNRIRVQVYTPLRLIDATVAGTSVPMVAEVEFGWNRYRRDLFIDAGSSVVLTVDLSGVIDPAAGYVLAIEHQPMVTSDQVDVTIDGPEPWEISTARGFDGSGRASIVLGTDASIGVTFGR